MLTSRSGLVVDEVVYDDGVLWPDQAGHSLNLDPYGHDVYRNDFGGRWCAASVPLGLSDFGTPGTPNSPCP